MNPSSGNKGVNHLAQAFVGEIDRRRSKDSALVLDFGEIQDDYSLKTNTFSIPIPVEDYHVCRQLTLGKTGDILAKTQAIGSPGSIRGMLTGYGCRKSCCSKRRSLQSFHITSVFWQCFRMCLLWRTRRWMRSCNAGAVLDIIRVHAICTSAHGGSLTSIKGFFLPIRCCLNGCRESVVRQLPRLRFFRQARRRLFWTAMSYGFLLGFSVWVIR